MNQANQLPLEIDDETGVWRADGSPVILIPRHFLLKTYAAFEAVAGAEKFREVMAAVGADAARSWCTQQAQKYQLKGMDILAHYLSRITLRGWGRFELLEHDLAQGTARVLVRQSAIALGNESGEATVSPVIFAPWIAAGLEVARASEGYSGPLAALDAPHPSLPGCSEIRVFPKG